ncbi:hypothetical protein CLOM_g3727 [Closterium sp. NIES-68]|nr:hypothetical protein CLOM_g3727 [Closterium sp. NIES-68]GJP80937.1 hypothetical protein CLOP_g11132 [Closterium sp. NIES-67]
MLLQRSAARAAIPLQPPVPTHRRQLPLSTLLPRSSLPSFAPNAAAYASCSSLERSGRQLRCANGVIGRRAASGLPAVRSIRPRDPTVGVTAHAVTVADDSSPASASTTSSLPLRAAFFDVDGTITSSNVVAAFVALRLRDMPLLQKAVWLPWFALNVVLYLILDWIDRGLFNRTFYRNYRGMRVSEKEAMADFVHTNYLKSKVFPGVLDHITRLRTEGFRIVLVTGSLDFLIEPLAKDVSASAVFAAKLKESDGRFTGELEGEAVSSAEKAAVIRGYAEREGIALEDCYAYGDSYADFQMLLEVGHAYAVRPDNRLREQARQRGWIVVEDYSQLDGVTDV